MKIKYPIKPAVKKPTAPITKFKRVAGKSTPPEVSAKLDVAETGMSRAQAERICTSLHAIQKLLTQQAERIQELAINSVELVNISESLDAMSKALANFVPTPDEPTPAAVPEEPTAEGAPACDPGKEGDTAD